MLRSEGCRCCGKERCLRSAARSPGIVASTSSLSGWVEYTPETTGATRLSRTFWTHADTYELTESLCVFTGGDG